MKFNLSETTALLNRTPAALELAPSGITGELDAIERRWRNMERV